MGEYNIMLQIQKRNGTLVPFDRQKIINAVNKALIEVDGQLYEDDTARDIAKEIEDAMYDLDEEKATAVSVEDIQDMVEDELMQSERRDVARAYIRYRYKQEVQREHEAVFIAPIREKLEARNVQNQNANVDEHSFGGRLGEAAEVMTKEYAFDYIISKKSRENHMNNEIYIHDAGSYAVGSHNCLSLPIDPLMEKGFNTRQTDVRPANSISTFFQLLAVLFQLQSLQQFGGVSATHLDWSAVPYVRKSFYKHFLDGVKYCQKGQMLGLTGTYEDFDLSNAKETWIKTNASINDDVFIRNEAAYKYAMDMTTKETKQAVEGMYHNLNTLQSRSGNQLPFTSINYGTCTLPEGRMVIKALLEGSLAGVGKIHKTSIFPCGIFQCMKGVNRKPGEPNYDLYRLALKSTAARLYPNYANCDWSGNAGYDPDDPTTYFSTMGCRTANGWDINGFGQKKDGRGNICPVTIILPTLAMEAKEKIDKEYELDIKCNPFSVTDEHYINAFMDLLDTKIHEAKDMLIERFDWICSQPADSAKFMYENGTMAGYVPEEGIRSALKHGTLAVGQLGLAEALQILIGTDHTTSEGMKLAKKIEQLFKDRCAEFKEKYKLNFGVYYTPAENLCYTALKKFRAKYGVIKDVSDKDFFTNSMHVPVWKEVSPFEKIDIECQLTGYSSAGCITYVELDGAVKNNLDALNEIVQYAMDHDIPYFAINVPNDTCLDCGYTGEFNDCCPICGSKNIQQLRRVTGYLTGNYKTAFNLGKQNEVNLRIKHIGRLEQ
jgi:ribonucleoside-triphosphate reductase